MNAVYAVARLLGRRSTVIGRLGGQVPAPGVCSPIVIGRVGGQVSAPGDYPIGAHRRAGDDQGGVD